MYAYNKVITAVKRLTYTGNRSELVSTNVNFNCYLEPLNAETSAQSGIQWGVGYKVFLDTGNDIIVSDVITLDSSDYTVKGKSDYDQLASHIELIVVKKE